MSGFTSAAASPPAHDRADAFADELSDAPAIQALLDAVRQPALMLHRPYPPTNLPAVRSRVGGLPNLPASEPWPWPKRTPPGPETVPLHFIAQIDLAEMPRIDPRLPERGMLFVFANQHRVEDWMVYAAHKHGRIVYVPDVPADTPERQPPPELPRMWEARLWMTADRPLPGEDAPRVFRPWPLVGLPIETWPPARAFGGVRRDPGHPLHALVRAVDALDTGFSGHVPLTRRTQSPLAPQSAPVSPAWKAYDRRVAALRAATVAAATGMPPERRDDARHPYLCEDAPNLAPDAPAGSPPHGTGAAGSAFPELGILMQGMARQVLAYFLDPGYGQFDGSRQRSEASRTELIGAARAWIERAHAIGLDAPVSAAEARAMTGWLDGIADSDPDPETMRYELRQMRWQALHTAITFSAASPEAAARIPAHYYALLQDSFLPLYLQDANLMQLLGHAPRAEELDGFDPHRHAPGERYLDGYPDRGRCLLHLWSDLALGMSFEGMGHAVFWIAPGDLKAAPFKRAVVQVLAREDEDETLVRMM